MSDNTFWLGIWIVILLFLGAFFHYATIISTNSSEREKAKYDKCISSGMQYINGNCLYGKGN